MRRAAMLVALAVVSSFAFAGVPGQAQDSTPAKVIDFKTIIASVNNDGSFHRVRLLDDLRVFGSGNVTVVDPSATQDVRNLLGYSGPDVHGGDLVYHIGDLNGSKQYLTVSTPDKQPPLSMAVAYTLNGKPISGTDLVGKSGDVGITFDVHNTTAQTAPVTYRDGTGRTQTIQAQVPLPMVAQLQLVLPPDHFTQVDAQKADVFTDPLGNELVNWSFVLVPPIGDLAQTATLKAHVDDFRLGQVRLVGAPVAPKDRAFLDYAETQLSGGVDSASSLYTGAGQIAGNLDTLHAGTLRLVKGLQRLYTGAQKLTVGLQQAFSGSGQLTTGIQKAAAGSGQLTSGLQRLESGSSRLTSGLGHALAGVGQPSDAATASIAGGLNALRGGLGQLLGGLQQLKAGLPGAKTAAAGIQQLANALAPNLITGPSSIKGGAVGIGGIVAGLAATASSLASSNPGCSGDATCAATLTGVAACLNGSNPNGCGAGVPSVNLIAAGIAAGAQSIADCLNGLGFSPCNGNPSIATIAAFLIIGVDKALAGLGSTSEPHTLIGGTSAALTGASQLLAGVSKLRTGLQQAFGGSGQITAGLGLAHNGSQQLTSGLGGQAAPGSAKLTTGLGQAHSGSGRIANGLGQAKGGGSQIEQGVYAINELGVKEVARSANDTAISIGQQLGMLQAEDQRAQSEPLLYKPPSSDQAKTVVGGSGVVLVMDELDGRVSDSIRRNIYVGIALLLLLGMALLARGVRRVAA